ncbi:MAG: hypothetical protein EKK35_06335 [Bradyrhizobiaceae bacterium]|nr:MAG: hypothetical protein EKK35_06335 [Bradyrhizobiaceae bacterium]
MQKTRPHTARRTMNEGGDAQEAFPEFSDETRAYLLSDAGIENMMRKLSDACENWLDCPVKRCRRARRCQGPDMVCQLKEPSRTAPREELARVNARMRQIVLQRLERIGVW